MSRVATAAGGGGRWTTWWVGFGEAAPGSMGWWHRPFTRPGFRHCLAWRAEGRHTLVVHPRADGLEVGISMFDPALYAAHAYRRLHLSAVLRLNRPPLRGRPVFRPFATCTEIVKAALAVDAWRIQTPHGLFRLLQSQPDAVLIPSPPAGEIIHG